MGLGDRLSRRARRGAISLSVDPYRCAGEQRSLTMEIMEWWMQPSVLNWTQLLLSSFYHWTGRELVEPAGTPEDQATALFAVPFVVVSHGNQNDPILNYGNRVALTLWEAT